MSKRIIVIGGSAAGPKAAAKARRMDEFAEITMFQKAPDLSMASCGFPYFVGGFFDDRNKLISKSWKYIFDCLRQHNFNHVLFLTQT